MANGIPAVFRSSNLALSDKVFDSNKAGRGDKVMTVQGTLDKIAILFGLLILSAGFSWIWWTDPKYLPAALMACFLAFLVSLVVGIVLWFAPSWSPFLAPLFSVAEGFWTGVWMHLAEVFYHGIVFQTVALTLGVVFLVFFCYRTGMIKVNSTFIMVVVAATGAIVLVYLVDIILNIFFHMGVPYINGSGPIGIFFNGVVVVLAAMNLAMDFKYISDYCGAGTPKYMEWYGAYGLLVTVAWVYIEIFRLLTKLRKAAS